MPASTSQTNRRSVPQQWLVRLVAITTAISGLIAILQPLSERLSGRFELFLTPFDYGEINRTAALFLGFTLIYFSSKLLQRKIIAWWTALVASIAIIIFHLFFVRSAYGLLLPILTVTVLLATRDQFRVRSESGSIWQGVRLLILSLVIALLYGVIGFWFLEKRDFGRTFGLREAAVDTIKEYTLAGNPDLIPHNRHARWFLHSLDVLGAISVGFGIYSLFRPLAYRLTTLPAERQDAQRILSLYGDSPEDYFKLWPEDKTYFFSASRSAFLAYRVAAGVAIVLNDPVGPASQLQDLVAQFLDFAYASGWVVAFVDVSEQTLGLFEPFGLRNLKIGEDAIVDLEHFTAEVASNKHFRHIRNRFDKEGYVFSEELPPHDRQLLGQIEQVSRQWLALPGRQERGFALGYYNRRYLSGMPLYLVRNTNNVVMGFANGIPSYHSPIATIDLMRHRADSLPSTMDYLFLRIMEHLHEGGARQFSLGLAPLSGMEGGEGRSPEERLLSYLYRSGGRLFSFSGLRQFKNKFEPQWHEKFLVYTGGPQTIPQIALALSQVLSRQA